MRGLEPLEERVEQRGRGRPAGRRDASRSDVIDAGQLRREVGGAPSPR